MSSEDSPSREQKSFWAVRVVHSGFCLKAILLQVSLCQDLQLPPEREGGRAQGTTREECALATAGQTGSKEHPRAALGAQEGQSWCSGVTAGAGDVASLR